MEYIQPTKEQIDAIVEALDGLEETWSNSLKITLMDLGLDPDLEYSVIFMDTLEDKIFHCVNCDKWLRVEIRVYNETAQCRMCEDCDDNY